MNRYMVKDARGHPRMVCSFGEAVAESGLPPDKVASPDRRATFFQAALGSGVMFTIIMTVVLGTVVGFFHGWKVWMRLIPWMPVMFVGYGVPIGYMASRYGWRSAKEGRDALLDAGLCPHCVYGIVGIPAESDGCVVCPECSAAWLVNDPSPRSPYADAARRTPRAASSRQA